MKKKLLSAVVTAAMMLTATLPVVSVNTFAVDYTTQNTSAPPDNEAIQLDWLPKTEAEYQDFVNEYGHLSVRDNYYIVYCDEINYSTGAEVIVDQSGEGEIKKIKEYNISDKLIPPGSPSKVVMVYVAVMPGDIQLTVSQSRYWDPNAELTEKETGTYVVNDDYTIEQKTSSDEIIMGDVNGDGTFSIADVLQFKKWLVKAPNVKLANPDAADLLKDNKLNALDLMLMKRDLITKLHEGAENTDTSFKLQDVADVRNFNDSDDNTKWRGFIASSENELKDIIKENEGTSAENFSIEGIDTITFNDKVSVIIYSYYSAGNQYSIIDDIAVKGNSIAVSTATKKPMIATPDMMCRRYVYLIDKNAVSNVNEFSFNDESSYYQYEEESDIVKWFENWCKS